jgi:hypothetical protein
LHVKRFAFQDDIRGREGSDITAGASEGYPRGWNVVAGWSDQGEVVVLRSSSDVRDEIGPVEERGRKVNVNARAVGTEYSEAVGDEDAGIVRVEARCVVRISLAV